MINRIRDIRREKGLTLADVAARCAPPTTAQTIGRLETGTRNLSLVWMNRIAAALDVEPELLVRSEEPTQPSVVARLVEGGAEALSSPREAILPSLLAGAGRMLAISVEASAGDYRAGDQIWLREASGQEMRRLMNRDVLAPRAGGRFAFGRLIDASDTHITLLPPGSSQRPLIIRTPDWLAGAEMLVRRL